MSDGRRVVGVMALLVSGCISGVLDEVPPSGGGSAEVGASGDSAGASTGASGLTSSDGADGSTTLEGSTSAESPDSSDSPDDPPDASSSSSGGQPEPALDHAPEGHGAVATGGEGGVTLRVTTLDDSGPGSLREAIAAAGPRIIEFDVAGIIRLDSPLSVDSGDLTIDGSTAPAPGITLRGQTIDLRARNIIIEHLRIREQGTNRDGIVFRDGAREIVISHCSLSWSGDDTIGTDKDGGSSDITIQWSIIAEPRMCMVNPEKACGRNLFSRRHDMRRVTMHHNLWLNSFKGVPPGPGLPRLEFINNLLFFYEQAPQVSGGPVDLIGNVFRPQFDHGATIGVSGGVSVYVRDNLSPHRAGDDEPQRAVLGGAPQVADEPHSDTGVTVDAAAELEGALLPSVGASRPCRDGVDARLIDDMRDGQGQLVLDPAEVGGFLVECAEG